MPSAAIKVKEVGVTLLVMMLVVSTDVAPTQTAPMVSRVPRAQAVEERTKGAVEPNGMRAQSPIGNEPFLAIHASPNPVTITGHMAITILGLKTIGNAALKVRVIDVLGRTVVDLTERLQIDNVEGSAIVRVPASAFTPGTFFVCAQAGSFAVVRKVQMLASR